MKDAGDKKTSIVDSSQSHITNDASLVSKIILFLLPSKRVPEKMIISPKLTENKSIPTLLKHPFPYLY